MHIEQVCRRLSCILFGALLLLMAAGGHAQAPAEQAPVAPSIESATPEAPTAVVPTAPDSSAPVDEASAPAADSVNHEAAPEAEPEVDLSAYLGSAGASSSMPSISDPSLRFYGFADFGLRYVDHEVLRNFLGETPSFFLGNVNLYAAADLSENWRSLVEVRFTYLPDGTLDSNFKRVSTVQNDYANIGANLRWGGISLERAWLEYTFNGLLTVRGGSWLTPVGIWNVDHGTPTIIPTMRPFVVSSALFPTRQTGIEVYGSRLIHETTVGYHLTLSNGRGSIASYGDLDKNKALGARLYVGLALGDSTLTIGYSFYLGRNTETDLTVGMAGLQPQITLQHDELSMAGDLLWKWEGLHFQSELFSQQVKYTAAGAAAPPIPGPNGGVFSDFHKVGGYAVLGYRFAAIPIMPYIEGDMLFNNGAELSQPGGPNKVFTLVGGLNYRPIPSVTLKAQYARLMFRPLREETLHVNAFDVVAAWSF